MIIRSEPADPAEPAECPLPHAEIRFIRLQAACSCILHAAEHEYAELELELEGHGRASRGEERLGSRSQIPARLRPSDPAQPVPATGCGVGRGSGVAGPPASLPPCLRASLPPSSTEARTLRSCDPSLGEHYCKGCACDGTRIADVQTFRRSDVPAKDKTHCWRTRRGVSPRTSLTSVEGVLARFN